MQYSGWNLLEDGSIRIEEATEDALGTYTCVPYNALGTMGQSPPARLVLKVTLLPKSHGFAGSSALLCQEQLLGLCGEEQRLQGEGVSVPCLEMCFPPAQANPQGTLSGVAGNSLPEQQHRF